MIYDSTEDKHITIKLLKEKGWVIFDVTSSKCNETNGSNGGWWIDCYAAYKTKYYESHESINHKFLGCTLKEAISTIKHKDFPINK